MSSVCDDKAKPDTDIFGGGGVAPPTPPPPGVDSASGRLSFVSFLDLQVSTSRLHEYEHPEWTFSKTTAIGPGGLILAFFAYFISTQVCSSVS